MRRFYSSSFYEFLVHFKRRCLLGESRWVVGFFLLALVLASFSRFTGLGEQPALPEELTNSSVFSGGGAIPIYNWAAGFSPLWFYLCFYSGLFWGDFLYGSRFVSAVFSLAVVLLPWFYRRELRAWGYCLLSLCLAISPAFVFYGRLGFPVAVLAFFLVWGTLSVVRWGCFTRGLYGARAPWGVGLWASLLGMVLISGATGVVWVFSVLLTAVLCRGALSWGVLVSLSGRFPFWFFSFFVSWAAFLTSFGQVPLTGGVLLSQFSGLSFSFLGDGYYWFQLLWSKEPLAFFGVVLLVLVLVRLLAASPGFLCLSVFLGAFLVVYSFFYINQVFGVLGLVSLFYLFLCVYFGYLEFLPVVFFRWRRLVFIVLFTLGLMQFFDGLRLVFPVDSEGLSYLSGEPPEN